MEEVRSKRPMNRELRGQKISKAELKLKNDANVNNMVNQNQFFETLIVISDAELFPFVLQFEVIQSEGWDHVVSSAGIKVWKKILAPGTHLKNDAADDKAAAKFACIKATAVSCTFELHAAAVCF